jgi:hypothetical protein
LSTDAEVLAKSSSTLAVTPASLLSFPTAFWSIPDISGSVAVVSTGATFVSAVGVRLRLVASGSASGQSAARYFGATSNATVPHLIFRGLGFPSLGVRFVIGCRMRLATTQADAIHRFTFGKQTTSSVGDLSAMGIGLRVVGTGAVELQVHDGTNLTNVTSSFTPTTAIGFDVIIENVGNGTVNLYINDSLVATTSAGSSSAYTSTTVPNIWAESELTGSIAAEVQFMLNNIYLGQI